MFGKKKNNINKVVVSSKEELKTAIKRKEPYIEVQGDLAKKMKWMGKLSSVKIAAIIALLTSLAAVPGWRNNNEPLTGGVVGGEKLMSQFM